MMYKGKCVVIIGLIMSTGLMQASINDTRNDPKISCYNSKKAKICCVAATACASIPLLTFGLITSNIYATSAGGALLGVDLMYAIYKGFSLIDGDDVLSRPDNYYARYSQSNFPDDDDAIDEHTITEIL